MNYIDFLDLHVTQEQVERCYPFFVDLYVMDFKEFDKVLEKVYGGDKLLDHFRNKIRLTMSKTPFIFFSGYLDMGNKVKVARYFNVNYNRDYYVTEQFWLYLEQSLGKDASNFLLFSQQEKDECIKENNNMAKKFQSIQ